ncbi:sphinganine C4-monooxygenase 1-like [Wolffia australiana]
MGSETPGKMAITDELLPVITPVISYWITVAIYHKLVDPKKENRIFSEDEEDNQNVVPPKEVLRGVFVNQAMQIILAFFYFTILGRGKAKAAQSTGSFVQVSKQLAIAMLVLDTWEYFMHRLMHENQYIFRNFHGMHHYLKVPYSYGGQYVHLVDAFIAQLMGSVISVELSGMSPTTSAVFFSLMSIKVVDDHCSRWFPKSNPLHRFLRNNVAFHGVHHQLPGFKYNYSIHFLSTWDVLLGTYLPYTVEEKKEGGYCIRTSKED